MSIMIPPKKAVKVDSPSRDVFIAVMGPTGAGKSTFINKASGSDLRVGTSLMSCTDKIELGQPFPLDDCLVTLVDTPGFDDTTKSDADVLNIVADYLASEYIHKRLFHGIIYMHRISDNRITGTAYRNLRFLRDLCGPDALCNALVVTNMWGSVDPAVGAAREDELKRKDMFLKPILAGGGKVMRHDNTTESTHGIIRELLHITPRPLQLQRELVDEGKRIFETVAGETLLQELARLQQAHAKEKAALAEDFEEVMQQQDEESRAEIEEAQRKLAEEEAQLEETKRRLMEFQLMIVQKQAELLSARHDEAGTVPEEARAKLLPSTPPQIEEPADNGNVKGVDDANGPIKKPRSALSRLLHGSGLRKLFAPFFYCLSTSKQPE